MDGTLSLLDVHKLNDALDVKVENERRIDLAIKQGAK